MSSQTRIAPEFELSEEIALALADGGLELYYQPIINLRTHEVAAVEALVRLPSIGIGGFVVDELVGAAESSGLVGPLDDWVLRAALHQLAEWQRGGIVASSFALCINASSLVFESPGFPSHLAHAVADSGVDPHGVVIEITETRALADLDAARTSATAVHEMGMRLSLDDFGSGYSNFARLQALSFDVIKIDRCFTEACDTTIGEAFIAALVGLARTLGAKVVAEGIETADQAARMRRAGCDAGQGFLWAPGLPATLIEEFLRGTAPLTPLTMAPALTDPTEP